MNPLQIKAMWLELKSDIKEYGFLNALNNACYDYGYLHTLPFTEERDKVMDNYIKRRNNISRLRKKFHK